jgi:hypothetical protein
VELIRRALTIGFSLAELKIILVVRDAGVHPATASAACCVRRMHDLNQQIRNLVYLRAEMKKKLIVGS